MIDDLGRDLRRCGATPRERLRELLLSPGAWAVAGYRFRRWAYLCPARGPLRWPLMAAAALAQVVVEAATAIQLPASASIGPGLYIPHVGYIVVSSKAVIGRDCTIAQGVTIGHGGGGGKSLGDAPRVGDRAYLGPGSILIGPIQVGDDALIGAGAVVVRSVPPRGVVAGNPARLISDRGSFDLIDYPGRDRDPDRIASMALARPDRPSAGFEPEGVGS